MGSKQALEGSRQNAFGFDPNDLVIIGLDTADGPGHPAYDQRNGLPIDERLVESMIAFGWFGAITVQKTSDGKAMVVAGRQRVRAAREANRRLVDAGKEPIQVTCIPRRGDGIDMLKVAENEIRQDDDPLTKSEKASELINRGRTEDQVALAFGMSKLALANLLRLGEAHPRVKKAVRDGQINATAAYAIAKLDLGEQETALDEIIASGGGHGGGAAAQKLVKAKRAKDSGEEAYPAPTAKTLRALLKCHDEFPIDPGAVAFLRWLHGEGSPAKISGLCGALKAIEKKSEDRAAKKAARAKADAAGEPKRKRGRPAKAKEGSAA